MDIAINTGSPEKLQTGVLAVGAFADGPLPSAARAIDEASRGKVSSITLARAIPSARRRLACSNRQASERPGTSTSASATAASVAAPPASDFAAPPTASRNALSPKSSRSPRLTSSRRSALITRVRTALSAVLR